MPVPRAEELVMASNRERAATLVRALEASVVGDSTVIADVYTDDVRGSAPAFAVSSAAELAVELEDRGGAFSDVELDVSPLDVADDRACVEWVATLTHTGPLELAEETVIEPTGFRVTLHGITLAEFEGDRISAFRQYWDEVELLEQLARGD
jgi:SnoaL-like polyketide cyclase